MCPFKQRVKYMRPLLISGTNNNHLNKDKQVMIKDLKL